MKEIVRLQESERRAAHRRRQNKPMEAIAVEESALTALRELYNVVDRADEIVTIDCVVAGGWG
jgi:hypothetical protein